MKDVWYLVVSVLLALFAVTNTMFLLLCWREEIDEESAAGMSMYMAYQMIACNIFNALTFATLSVALSYHKDNWSNALQQSSLIVKMILVSHSLILVMLNCSALVSTFHMHGAIPGTPLQWMSWLSLALFLVANLALFLDGIMRLLRIGCCCCGSNSANNNYVNTEHDTSQDAL